MPRLRLAFMGTPDFAAASLAALIAAGHDIAAVYSQPPRPAGRGHQPRPSPVQQLAQSHGLPVLTELTGTDRIATSSCDQGLNGRTVGSQMQQ